MKHLNYIKQSKCKACITIFKALLLSLGFLSLVANAGQFDPSTEEEMEARRLKQIQWGYQSLSTSFESEEWIEIAIRLKHVNPSIDMDTPKDSPLVVLEIEKFLGYLPGNSYKTVEDVRPRGSEIGLKLEISRDALDEIYNYPYIKAFHKPISFSLPKDPMEDSRRAKQELNQKTISTVEIKAQDYQLVSQQISSTGALASVVFSIVLPDHITTLEEGTKVVDDIVNQAMKLVELSGQSPTKKLLYHRHRVDHSNVHHKQPVSVPMRINFGALDYLNQNELVTRIKVTSKN